MKHRLNKQQSRSVIEAFILNNNHITLEILTTFIISLGKSQLYKSYQSFIDFIENLIIFSTSALCSYKTGLDYETLKISVMQNIIKAN